VDYTTPTNFPLAAQYSWRYLAEPSTSEDDPIEGTGYMKLPHEVATALFQHGTPPGPKIQIFRVTNPSNNVSVYLCNLEFVADPGTVTLPGWALESLELDRRQPFVTVTLLLTPMTAGTRVVFRAANPAFMKLQDPRAVLESPLSRYPALSRGSTIHIRFAGEIWRLHVVATFPQSPVFIQYSDLVTEFAPLESEFVHDWQLPDTDSSDPDRPPDGRRQVRRGAPRVIYRRSLKDGDGKPEPAPPLWSTFEKREKERLQNPERVGVTEYKAGELIRPPKAEREDDRKAPSLFVGKGTRVPRYRPGHQPPPTTEPIEAVAARTQAKSDSFVGKGRALADEGARPPPPSEPRSAPLNPPAKQSAFVGRGRSLQPESAPAETPAVEHEDELAPEPPKAPAESAFKGKGRSLS
jgi:hypothetical protein